MVFKILGSLYVLFVLMVALGAVGFSVMACSRCGLFQGDPVSPPVD